MYAIRRPIRVFMVKLALMCLQKLPKRIRWALSRVYTPRRQAFKKRDPPSICKHDHV